MAIREYEVKAVDAAQAFKITTVMLMIIFLITGLTMLIINAFFGVQAFLSALAITVGLILVVAPINGAINAVACWIYNFTAKKVGGCKFTLGVNEK